MTLDELLLGKIREGSRGVWRGVRSRLGLRLILLILLAHAVFLGGLWLLGLSSEALLHRGVAAVKAGTILLPLAALLGSIGLAWVDSVQVLVVTGTLLGSLGDALTDSPLPSGGLRPEDQLATFASPERLARSLRLRDLPLLLFLTRVIFRLDIKPLLGAAHTGLGREALIREMERMGRQRAAALLRRLRAATWLCLGGGVLLALLVARFSR